MRLISEAARGEGGRVWVPRDGKPWYFLEEWYPAYGNTVPRDIASRAIWKVVKDMKLGVDGEDVVYLDLTHLDHEAIAERLEGILEIYEKFVGEDPRKVPMKVFPAVHYSMGGVWVDLNHMSNVAGLFAAGECDYQYHGANRLGANSLLSAVHSGMIAGPASVEYAKGLKKSADSIASSIFENERQNQEEINQKFKAMDGQENPHQLRQEMTAWLTEHATIVRHNKMLKETDDKIQELAERFERSSIHDKGSWANEELFFMRTFRNQFDLARLVLLAAVNREESRGSHYKPETPNRDDDKWLTITKASYTPEGPKLEYSEKVEILDIKPVARRYDVAH
jgi:succinate dehydrogenase / fumarate reductase flavoprotein subunit